jgi:alpha-ketoglutarate-dependent taurine dioxygenase
MSVETKTQRTVGVQDDALPYLIQADPATGPLAAWAGAHLDRIHQRLYRHGAVLFRGFHIGSQEAFEEVAGRLSQGLVAEGGEHQRLSDDSQVYTPVAYPPDKFLMWHNEDSFNPQWPRKIMFCPVRVPARGGETPLVDAREVYSHLGPEILQPFLEKGVLYHRTYGLGIGRSWQDIFRTDDEAEVEAYCAENGIDVEWRGEGLITRQQRSAVARHHATGELVWFAQAQHWHPACLDPETRASLESLFEPEEMPRNCFYGDGSTIEDEVMERICDAYRELQVSFPWEVGDVMLVDNVLAAHARNSYQGERKLLVALGELTGDYNL